MGDELLKSWDILHPSRLKPHGIISNQFLQLRLSDYREVGHYISHLPYGRNSNSSDPLIVLKEHRGTCSTKHVLMSRLAVEQDFDVGLFIGIYEMTANNTAGIGAVLERHHIISLPEAHCYLGLNGTRVDLTRPKIETIKWEPITQFLHEEEIEPDQADTYKRELHRRFLQRWIERSGVSAKYTAQDLWNIREQCIAALERSN